jgi:hypothetical protein
VHAANGERRRANDFTARHCERSEANQKNNRIASLQAARNGEARKKLYMSLVVERSNPVHVRTAKGKNIINRPARGIKSKKMGKVDLRKKTSRLKGVFMSFAALTAALMLFTSCGSQKSVAGTTGNVEVQSPEYQLSGDCALLHIYRPGGMVGMAISYDLHLNDEVVFFVKNKSKTTIKITS